MPQEDGPFQIIKRINDSAYKVDLSGEYGVSVIFNVSNLFSFDASDDLRMDPFNEKGNYVIPATLNYPLQVSIGLVIKLTAKRFK